MSDYLNDTTGDPSVQAFGQKPPKSWFGRNWFWLIPTIILLPVFCCCGGGGALIWFSVGKVMDIAPFKDSIALAGQNTDVQNALGTPIDAPQGFMDLITMMQEGGQFNFNQSNNQFLFDAQVPVSGPNGSGVLRVEAESVDGGMTWTYTLQEVELPDGTVIDLLAAGGSSSSGGGHSPDKGREIPDQE